MRLDSQYPRKLRCSRLEEGVSRFAVNRRATLPRLGARIGVSAQLGG
jgi:hypothetical protein